MEERVSDRKAVTGRGALTIGDVEIECYVLDDKMRVITNRGAVKALTGNAAKKAGAGTGDLARYIGNLPRRFADLSLAQEIEFDTGNGALAHGRSAAWFIKVCNAYVDAFFAGELRPNQAHLAANARAIVAAAATVGIEDMIDEATGYLPDADDTPTARFVKHLFRTEPRAWERFWPEDVVREFCRTFRIRQTQAFPAPLLGVIGKLYNTRFGDDGHEELKRINPRGPDRDMHHQHFEDRLLDMFNRDMGAIRAYLIASSSKDMFWELWTNYCNGGGQLRWW
jgi:hypothetical protein